MSTPRIIYRTREDADPEREQAALAVIYVFILERHQRKGTAPAGDPEIINGTESREISADGPRIQQTPK